MSEDAPETEIVRRDLSDGKRHVDIFRIKGTTPLFFKAKMSVDADGSPRAYHPDNIPEALDVLSNSEIHSQKYIQGKLRNGHIGKGPRPGFFVSGTALQHGEDHDADSFVDAEFIPYIVLPARFADGVRTSDVCTVVNLTNERTTSAIFADTNPDVGEASVRAAINLGVSPTLDITEIAKRGGDAQPNYLYIVYPGSRFPARPEAPHWPAETIETVAAPLFEKWGGLAMVKKLFG